MVQNKHLAAASQLWLKWSSFNIRLERTYCSCSRGMYVDDTSHIWAHWVYGCVRSEPKVVDAQISRALVHHLTYYVYFHLHMAEKKKNKLTVISE